jgi:acyl carrier protein
MLDEHWKATALTELQPIFRALFLDDKLVISENTSPADIEEWDSLAHVTLLSAVEAKFGVRFSAEDMGRINDVSTLLDVLWRAGGRSAEVSRSASGPAR